MKKFALGLALVLTVVSGGYAQEPLFARQTFGLPVDQPVPFSLGAYWQRKLTQLAPDQIDLLLALDQQVDGGSGYPYTLGVRLDTAHTGGDAVGSYLLLHNRASGWAAAYHTDVYHYGSGNSIGVNIEPRRQSPEGRVLGVNIQTRDLSVDEGINLQSGPGAGYTAGIRFDQGSFGQRAIAIDGEFEVGVDLGVNDLRLQPGARIYLGQNVYFVLNPKSNQVELHNGDTVLWAVPAGG